MDYLNWIIPFIGLGGISIAFYVLGGAVILSTVNSLLLLLSPVMVGCKEFLTWYFRNLWEGIGVVMKNTSTFLVIATIAAGTAYAGVKYTKSPVCPKPTVCKQLKNQKATPPAQTEWWDPLGIL